jgi:structure-specific endonuclease subunit SLX1
MTYNCYLIRSKSNPNHTYIGITNNIERRLKQHNGIISGGAKCTKRFNDWEYVVIVELDNSSIAASFEYSWKHYKTKNGNTRHALSGLDNKFKRLDVIKQEFKVSDSHIQIIKN